MNLSSTFPEYPPEQQAIGAKCFHPSGSFIEFAKEEVEHSIPARFEKQVSVYPDRIAVKTRRHSLTYAELNGAANRAAHAILAHRAKGEKPVAFLLGHDVSLISAILGALKAGKMCVVLDPSLPRARIAYILEDSQAALLVTDSKHLASARELAHPA
jgi:non-ribosomal peptide synthetase component F